MAGEFVFDTAKGRVAELFRRVDIDDPSASVLVLVPLSAQPGTPSTAGTATTLAQALVAGANLTAHRYDCALPQYNWNTPGNPQTGNNTVGLLVCYDPLGTSVNTTTIPMTYHQFAVTADGNEVVLNAGTFFQAS
jgi:hypothetical protein